jgi:hypothetical protein
MAALSRGVLRIPGIRGVLSFVFLSSLDVIRLLFPSKRSEKKKKKKKFDVTYDTNETWNRYARFLKYYLPQHHPLALQLRTTPKIATEVNLLRPYSLLDTSRYGQREPDTRRSGKPAEDHGGCLQTAADKR